MERGAWWATVCGEAKSWTQLRDRAYIPTVIYNAVLVSGVKHRDSVIHTHAYSFLNMYIYTHTCVCSVASVVSDSVILWTVACQAPLSMGFSRQEYWSRWSCPPPRDLPDPGMEPASLMPPALAGRFFTTSATWEVPKIRIQGSKKKIRKHLMSFPPSSQEAAFNQMPGLTAGLE